MTKIILDPISLPYIFPSASESEIFRVRIFAQVLGYKDEESTLRITKICNAPKYHNYVIIDESDPEKYLDVSIHNILPEISNEVTIPGSLVSIVGYWNGEELNVIECNEFNGESLLPFSNLETLNKLASIEDFE